MADRDLIIRLKAIADIGDAKAMQQELKVAQEADEVGP